MVRITDNADEITVQSIPVKDWIIAGSFTFVFVSVISLWLLYGANSSGLVWLFYLAVILAGFVFVFMNEATTIRINKTGKTVSVRKHTFYKYSFEVFSFDEIEPIFIESTLSGRQGDEKAGYQTILPLKNGDHIKLSIRDGLKDYEYFDLIDKMNSYISDTSKQIPFKLTIFEDD